MKSIKPTKRSILVLSTLLLLGVFTTGCTTTDTTDKSPKKESITQTSNAEKVDTSTISPTVVTGKEVTKTSVKSIAGTTTYEKMLQNNKENTANHYKLEDHLIKEDAAKLSFYKTDTILYEDMLKQKDEKYLVYVYSPSCVYCRAYYDTLMQYTDATDSLRIYKLNLDIIENAEIMAHYNVQGTPTMLYIEKGNVKKIVKGQTTFDMLMSYGQPE